MICCFHNLHEQENAKDLEKHFDKEIETAIEKGCNVFLCGKNIPRMRFLPKGWQKVQKDTLRRKSCVDESMKKMIKS